ncbi:MAG TPA: beta-glucosidase [Desulfurococcales archaeon]|nr:beta-glucosidase [Desulfurococcales archaeon]
MSYIIIRLKQGKIEGLLGKYFIWKGEKPPEEITDDIVKYTRIDGNIDFTWWDSPAENIPAEYFGVEWTGYLVVPVEGTYRFFILSDDGSKFWLDGQLLIDAWRDQAPTIYHSPLVELSAGYHKLRLLFYNRHPYAVVKLGWIKANGESEIIPPENFATQTGSSISIEGLPENYKVELWSGGKICEAIVRKGIAVMDVKDLETPIDGYFKVYNDKGDLVYESPVIRDIWGGDVYRIALAK